MFSKIKILVKSVKLRKIFITPNAKSKSSFLVEDFINSNSCLPHISGSPGQGSTSSLTWHHCRKQMAVRGEGRAVIELV